LTCIPSAVKVVLLCITKRLHSDKMNNSQIDPAPDPFFTTTTTTNQEEKVFTEFRRKVRDSELLSAAIVRLLGHLRFTGRLSVVVQNGRVLKSGYEEGYFSRRHDQRLVP